VSDDEHAVGAPVGGGLLQEAIDVPERRHDGRRDPLANGLPVKKGEQRRKASENIDDQAVETISEKSQPPQYRSFHGPFVHARSAPADVHHGDRVTAISAGRSASIVEKAGGMCSEDAGICHVVVADPCVLSPTVHEDDDVVPLLTREMLLQDVELRP